MCISTLQGTNISPKNGILKMIFLFPRGDMLVPWRVYPFITVTWPFRKLRQRKSCLPGGEPRWCQNWHVCQQRPWQSNHGYPKKLRQQRERNSDQKEQQQEQEEEEEEEHHIVDFFIWNLVNIRNLLTKSMPQLHHLICRCDVRFHIDESFAPGSGTHDKDLRDYLSQVEVEWPDEFCKHEPCK